MMLFLWSFQVVVLNVNVYIWTSRVINMIRHDNHKSSKMKNIRLLSLHMAIIYSFGFASYFPAVSIYSNECNTELYDRNCYVKAVYKCLKTLCSSSQLLVQPKLQHLS